MEAEVREQILKIAKEKGISFEEEVEIIRKGFVEQKKVDMYEMEYDDRNKVLKEKNNE